MKKYKRFKYMLVFVSVLLLQGCSGRPIDVTEFAKDLAQADLIEYKFENASVHDPSIIEAEGEYFVFGSHLAAAKSEDLMNWKMVARSVRPKNPMFPDVDVTLSDTLEWAQTKTFWAPDVIRLSDGNYYFYYNACRGDSPLSAMGVAKSDSVDGPYDDLGIILKSGMSGPGESGSDYNATEDPNVVDPDVFYDHEGKLWMVYGSYSGGIFILEIDESTGKPYPQQGYGKKLLGANHARIEGPYILYSPESEYYYLFLSFGGLDATGGYNIRVARSRTPDGPYYDSQGQDMIAAQGSPGKIFDDPVYEPYGHKLMGSFQFVAIEGENTDMNSGYVSPGHNSAFYDEAEDKYYLIFHTRFPDRGEMHQVRVHQFFLNDDGWPVVTPYRYTGEALEKVLEDDVIGSYKLVNHGHDISADIHESSLIVLRENGKILGDISGKWELYDGNKIKIRIQDDEYTGYFLKQYDEAQGLMTMTFTVGGNNGVSLWGSQVWLNK